MAHTNNKIIPSFNLGQDNLGDIIIDNSKPDMVEVSQLEKHTVNGIETEVNIIQIEKENLTAFINKLILCNKQ